MQIYFAIGKIQSMQMYFAFGKIQPMQIYIAIWKNTIRANIFSNLEKYNLRKYIFQFGAFLLARQQWSVGENSWPQCGEPAGSPGIIRCTNLHPIHINTSRNPLLGDINRCKNVISYLYWIRLGPGLFGQIHYPPLLRIGLIDMYWAMGEVERNIRPLRRGLDRMGHLAHGTALRFE